MNPYLVLVINRRGHALESSTPMRVDAVSPDAALQAVLPVPPSSREAYQATVWLLDASAEVYQRRIVPAEPVWGTARLHSPVEPNRPFTRYKEDG